MPNFDLFICLKDADNENFELLLESAKKFISPRKIIIATTKNSLANLQKFASENVLVLDESVILDGLNIKTINEKFDNLKQNGVKYRAGWYLQQFLKMAFALYAQRQNATNERERSPRQAILRALPHLGC